jgi:ribosomal RNA-processing protein 7
MSTSSSVPLLKGYLPIRVLLPPTWSTEYHDETFFYVREHQAGKGGGSTEETPTKPKSTLFVANAPVVPGISTKILLQSLLGRFADIARVTVIRNPRGTEAESAASLKWTDKFQDPSFLPVIHSEGKYAHVVFENPKGMKKALRVLQDVMKPSKAKGGQRPGLVLEPIEIQTLSDETNRIYREERKKLLNLATNDDDDDVGSGADEMIAADQATGIHAVVARYKASVAEMSRERLMEECNSIMQAYEEMDEEKKRSQQGALAQPDEDGFVTVSYSSAVGSQVELEATKHATGSSVPRRKGNMRSRRKKEAVGSQELKDFYRFQRRENKKRTLEDLRAQFDEDLKRVKRMKEEHHYRPF